MGDIDEPDDVQIRVRDGAAVWLAVEQETVLLDLEHGAYLGLNRAGSMLWPAMVQGAKMNALVEMLSEQAGISQEQARRDVSAFVAACRQRDLLLQ